ncbi:aldose 1-epimerase [Scopulibacillus daqui]|uniref:Aldose 1-epimerase n=1 Tax=Scopulibacillus daqui TaxID=1469162 RepID=A0ABS2Q0S5_9BACL|nr:aldose 1-epimerase [Scopulibacillus daqui]MBM7645899.1 aldose 1-epimerase [Scopulibacillus daqui]
MAIEKKQDNGVKKIIFNGFQAYELNHFPYQAVVIPEFGGNLVAFRDVEKDYRFIREPLDIEDFKQNPCLYGIPVLFPPNRYEDGTFEFQGHVYQFPINEKSKNNHLHGFFYDRPWEVAGKGQTENSCYIELSQTIDEQTEVYRYFPHPFTIILRYSLSSKGLSQKVSVINKGTISMPLMLGFHTSIHAPFAKNSKPEDYTVYLAIKDRIDLNERSLPTGKRLPLDENEKKLAAEGISPYFNPLDHHYSAVNNGGNCMILTDKKEKVSLVYDVGNQYHFWMFYNKDAKSGFFCPEPQTGMVNSPNVNLPSSHTGLIELKPGDTWTAESRLYKKEENGGVYG